jgi:hypothetical protein
MSFQIEFLERLEGELRAAAVRRSRFGTRRGSLAPRALLVAAAVVLMSGSLALAFGGRVLNAFSGKPAPSHVKSEFRQMTQPPYPLDGAPPLPKGYLPGALVKGSEHQVLAIRNSRGKVARLYVARTVQGRLCFVASGWPFGSAGCLGPTPSGAAFAEVTDTATVRRAGPHSPYAHGISGRTASPRAATVRFVYPDGTHSDVRLVDGWFMFELAASHSTAATGPVRADVLSAGGARLGTLRDPFHLHRVQSHFRFPVASSIRLLARAELPNSGGNVTIWSGRDPAGHDCFRHLRNGKSQMFPAWDCTAQVGAYGYSLPGMGNPLAHTPVFWQMAGANDWRRPTGFGYAYSTGWAAPQVARLTVRFQDGSASDIPLHDGYYVYVVPRANWPAGHRPSILEARNAQGAVLLRAFLYPRQHCQYPGYDPVCRSRALGTG